MLLWSDDDDEWNHAGREREREKGTKRVTTARGKIRKQQKKTSLADQVGAESST